MVLILALCPYSGPFLCITQLLVVDLSEDKKDPFIVSVRVVK